MTIRFYPSRLPGEPLETHEHGVTSLRNWLAVNVEGYEDRDVPPLTIEVDGLSIPPGEWATCVIHPESDVRLYPVPFGLEAATIAWIGVGISVAAAAYSLVLMSNIDTGGYTSSTGRSLDLNPARANTAKLGDAIREVFGRVRIYPDYVVQPVTRFDTADPTKMRVQMLLCLGVGELIYTNGDIRVGSTPASTLPGFSSTHYPPGADVSGDERSENWFNSTEVSGTSSGTGLDMAQTSPDSDDIIADSMTVSGASVTFTGLDTDDGDDDDEDDNSLPDSWVTGTIVEIKAPTNYLISTSSGYSVFASSLLTELAPVAGMPVTLSFNSVDYDLVIASYTPGQDAVPGEGGSAAKIQASAAPVNTGGIWNKCRHMIFNSMKVERDEGTHVLAGCLGMTFMAPGLTFNRNDIPQFLIKDFAKDDTTAQAASDSRGVIFEAPNCISSSAGNGWYFWHTSNAAPMEISNLFGNGTGLIFKGKNATIHGGTTYDCGPVLVDAEKDVSVHLVKWRAIKKPAVGDGTDDAIILRGANCKVEQCDFAGQPVDSASLAIPNGAFINSVASADSVIVGNTVGGYRQYGIRAAINQKVRDNKINLDNNHIGSLTNQSRSNSTLVIDNTTGFGLGTVNQSAPVLAAGATQELTIVGGCTDLHIRVISGTTAAAAKVLADSSIAGLGVYSQLNPSLLSFSAGTPGDGMVHITKPLSGYSITVANYTAGNVTVVITRISAMTTQ